MLYIMLLMSFNLILNYGLVSLIWDLWNFELSCYKHPWFKYFDDWEMKWPNGPKVLKSTSSYEITDLIIGFMVNHEIILKVYFYKMSTDNLKGVEFSIERVSCFGFLPQNYMPL